jgi:VanZ family protein
LSGQFIVGNAPATTDSWTGQVKGLAVYDRELAASEVAQHFAEWTADSTPDSTTSKAPDLARNAGIVAAYLFNEENGNVVHSQVESAPNLLIPERFFVVREQFLERPWDEYHAGWRYWQDVIINIAGFIPLGLFFRLYFSAIWKIKRATWLTIALGFAVSLTIEVLQAFLPTRDSGMTDLITNTSGTALGAILCAWTMKDSWFAQAGAFPAISLGKDKDREKEKEEKQFSTIGR